jgi:tetratricopeptide (TPR) repeat protein
MNTHQSRFPRAFAALFCLLALAPSVLAARAGDTPPPGGSASIQRLESAEAQLKLAASLKAAMRGTEGEEKVAARKQAIEGYRSVREFFNSNAAACAEASFRAGELLRSANDVAGAQSEFKIARDRGAGTAFRVRAMLEMGHLDRRAKRFDSALAAFEAVIAEESATTRQKDEASLWAGRVYVELARPADAQRVWKRVADSAEDPLDRIHAYDYLALALVEQGDLEGAAGMLERCREALSDAAQEESKLGERVRSALSGMRAIDDLAAAIAKRKSAPAPMK